MQNGADIIVIGGGAVGLSTAYHLAARGAGDVLLLERHSLTSGTSWHAAGIVGPLRATLNMTRLAQYACDLFPRLGEETGLDTGYRQTGGYWLATRPERMDELRRIRAMADVAGLTARLVEPPEIGILGLRTKDLAGALYAAEDGQVDPVGLCMAYAKAARRGGVTIRENAPVTRIETAKGRVTGVTLADGTLLPCARLALCAGAWSRALAETAGAALPLQAVEHMYVVTEPIPGLTDPFPILRDLDAGIYFKGDAGKLVLGGFEPDAKLWHGAGDAPFLELPEDWEQFAPFMEAGLHRCPALETAGIAHFMNGPESFTADTKPLIGPVPEIEGLYVAAGMNSVGVMSSAGVGRALAEWMIDGHPGFDLWEVDIARIDPAQAAPAHLGDRMREAVADQFAMHWPYKQPVHGRGLKHLTLHEAWRAEGAQFGVAAGWERPLWFGEAVPYSVGHQGWWPMAAAEAQAMAEGAALLDLSPFTKIDIDGPDALVCLQRLCTADMDVAAGRVVYTPILNDRGGIEIDATVTRLSKTQFRITSGAATRRRDLAWIARARGDCAVTVRDVSDAFAVLAVMGPDARDVMTRIFDSDLSPHGFPFRTARNQKAGKIAVLATRISYVGELGWELSVASAHAPRLYHMLRDAGAAGNLGLYAMDGCRIEKGFGHWGHEFGPDITPLEAGLSFTIDWSTNSTGRDALLRQREAGPRRRLVLFSVEGGPLLLHDEPIRENGKIVGLTSSGARGPRTGLDLCFGFVETEPDETRGETLARRYEIDIAGRRCRAQALAKPPYDPEGVRMRS